jgi:hypothetical protein
LLAPFTPSNSAARELAMLWPRAAQSAGVRGADASGCRNNVRSIATRDARGFGLRHNHSFRSRRHVDGLRGFTHARNTGTASTQCRSFAVGFEPMRCVVQPVSLGAVVACDDTVVTTFVTAFVTAFVTTFVSTMAGLTCAFTHRRWNESPVFMLNNRARAARSQCVTTHRSWPTHFRSDDHLLSTQRLRPTFVTAPRQLDSSAFARGCRAITCTGHALTV